MICHFLLNVERGIDGQKNLCIDRQERDVLFQRGLLQQRDNSGKRERERERERERGERKKESSRKRVSKRGVLGEIKKTINLKTIEPYSV